MRNLSTNFHNVVVFICSENVTASYISADKIHGCFKQNVFTSFDLFLYFKG